MLAPYFGRYQTLYMIPSHVQTMGRTFGPDLVIPTVQRQHVYQHLPEQHMFYHHLDGYLQQHQQQHERLHHQQQQTEENSVKNSPQRSQNSGVKTIEADESRQGKSNSEIKFSIDRILSNDCSRNNEEIETIKTEESATISGKEKVKTDVPMDTDESVHYEWLHCTRYRPPKLQRTRKKEGSKKRKLGRNPRVPFTQQQVVGLERKFGRTHYLSSLDVAELSSALNLSETRVKIWFQNRRARERRNNHSKQTHSQGSDPDDGHDSSLMFASPTSCFGSSVVLSPPASSRSLSQLHEALQHCSAFAPLPYRQCK